MVGEHGPELVNLPQGSQVFPADLTEQFFRNAGGVNTGDITVIVNESERPGETGEEVKRVMLRIFKELG